MMCTHCIPQGSRNIYWGQYIRNSRQASRVSYLRPSSTFVAKLPSASQETIRVFPRSRFPPSVWLLRGINVLLACLGSHADVGETKQNVSKYSKTKSIKVKRIEGKETNEANAKTKK